MWLGLALSYSLLCRASKLFACADGLVYPDFCLTRELFNDWGGRGYGDPSPGRSPKQLLPGIGLHDPLHGRQACPESNSLHQRVGQIPGRGFFRAVSSQNGGKNVTSPPPPPQSLNGSRDCLTFFRGDVQVNTEDRSRTDFVKVLLVASKTDQNREGCTTIRVSMAEGAGVGKTSVEAFEALVELLDAHPRRPGGAALTTRRTASGGKR